MRRIARLLVAPLLVAGVVVDPGAGPARAAGGWSWPVAGPVIRGFDPPSSPYGAGHRGIDIAAAAGTPVRAPAPGTVSFSGRIAGFLFLTIDHGFGLSSTYSWVSAITVGEGDAVGRGQVVASSGGCHPGDPEPCLHFGVRLGEAYTDPLAFLVPLDVTALIRLAPLVESPQRSASRMSGLGRTPLPRRGRARSPWAAGARDGWVGRRSLGVPGWSLRPDRWRLAPVPG